MKSELSGTVETVAPFVGAWIEMSQPVKELPPDVVAPFVGAWIEIILTRSAYLKCLSLRSSERGLKFRKRPHHPCICRRSVRRSVD